MSFWFHHQIHHSLVSKHRDSESVRLEASTRDFRNQCVSSCCYVHLLYSVRCSEESAYLLTYQHTSRNHSRMDQTFFFHFFPLTLSPFCTIWLFLSHLSLSLSPLLPSWSFPPTLLCQSLCWGCCAERTQQLVYS